MSKKDQYKVSFASGRSQYGTTPGYNFHIVKYQGWIMGWVYTGVSYNTFEAAKKLVDDMNG